jgi:crotonobetainyl-CoA:carnitine CoA-transferase CaiB-like acyl-CoA transferase
MVEKAGVPNGPLLSPADLANDDYVDEKGIVFEIDDPVLGKIPTMGTPIKMGSGYRTNHIAPPTLGQHNHEVYEEYLGWNAAKVDEMKKAGII